jgi:hypothetical protein
MYANLRHPVALTTQARVNNTDGLSHRLHSNIVRPLRAPTRARPARIVPTTPTQSRPPWKKFNNNNNKSHKSSAKISDVIGQAQLLKKNQKKNLISQRPSAITA